MRRARSRFRNSFARRFGSESFDCKRGDVGKKCRRAAHLTPVTIVPKVSKYPANESGDSRRCRRFPLSVGNCPTGRGRLPSAIVETLPSCVSPAASDGSSAAWQRLNRCPVWRGGLLNRWILRRSLQDKPSDAEILQGIGKALGAWFDGRFAWGVRQLGGNVRGLARRRPLDLVGPLGATARLLSPAPTMAGDSFASVCVDFFYLGEATDMPWPVLSSGGLWWPFDCSWALELVGVPDAA